MQFSLVSLGFAFSWLSLSLFLDTQLSQRTSGLCDVGSAVCLFITPEATQEVFRDSLPPTFPVFNILPPVLHL